MIFKFAWDALKYLKLCKDCESSSPEGKSSLFISHLDIMRLWERAFNRAGIPLAYSEGFNPHPRISLAVPLALGITSEAELMDIITAREVSPHWFTAALNRVLPSGIKIMQVYPMPLT